MTKRYVAGVGYLDIHGRRVLYAYRSSGTSANTVGHAHPLIANPNLPSSAFSTCKDAVETTYINELSAMHFSRTGAALNRHFTTHAALPCCHTAVLCCNCLSTRDTHDTATNKCTYAAGHGEYTLSVMDVYCPGWRDRWIPLE